MKGNMVVDKVKTADDSEKMWEEISHLPIQVYALSGQRVEHHVSRLQVPGKTLFLKLKSSSVLPALEEAVGSRFAVEVAEGYICIKRREDQTEAVKAALQKLQK